MSVNPLGLDEEGTVEETLEEPAKGWIEWVVDSIMGEPPVQQEPEVSDEPKGTNVLRKFPRRKTNAIAEQNQKSKIVNNCYGCGKVIPEGQPRYRLYSGNANMFCANCLAAVRQQRDRQRKQFQKPQSGQEIEPEEPSLKLEKE